MHNLQPYVLALAASCTTGPQQPLFVPAPGSPFAVGGGAGNVALGDVNADGYLDLAVAGDKPSAVAILWGDGSGRFASTPGASIALATPPGELLLVDLNGDEKLDVGITSHDSYDVIVLLGDGRGGFVPAPGSPFAAGSGRTPHNHGLQAGDANEDGHLDLFAVQSTENTVALLLGDGRGGFALAPKSPFAVGPAPYPPALGDLDGDGHLDLAVPETGTGAYFREHKRLARTVTLLLGDGDGGFRAAPDSPLSVSDGPYYVTLGDLDGDGALDLVTSHDDSDRITILLNDGKARFRPAPQSPLAIGRRAWKAIVADANADGKNDVLLGTGDSVTLLLGDGRGALSPASGSPFAVGRGAWRPVVGDIDRDGKLDLASCSSETGSVSVLLGR